MKIVYKKSFEKDIKKIKSKLIRQEIKDTLMQIKRAENIYEISGVKKLKGHKNAYRVRIGDYRMGFFFTGNTATIVRFVDRKDIYKRFP